MAGILVSNAPYTISHSTLTRHQSFLGLLEGLLWRSIRHQRLIKQIGQALIQQPSSGLTTDAEIQRRKTAAIRNGWVSTDFNQLVDNGSRAGPRRQVECRVSGLVLCIDNLRHKPGQGHWV
jgi:hypothetical protein